jgi:Putative Flp pilus-assembly TadE/G-like
LRRHRTKLRTESHCNHEEGVIITLVAVFLLFVIGAMAALSIDVVTFYTARSEAQLAADSGALAAARVLANSGVTSNPGNANLVLNAEALALNIATQVARQNNVGGRLLNTGEVTVNFNVTTPTNPRVTVQAQRTDIPTFFARIWGSTQVTVGASATAEAYNPSGAYQETGATTPVAPLCVKPWLLPNMDPSPGGTTIFDKDHGGITNTGLLGFPSTTAATRLRDACPGGNCSAGLPPPTAWKYYPGDPATTFAPPTQALPACSPALTTAYENSIAGCIPTPISCNSVANIDLSNYGAARNTETSDAVNCLTHSTGDQGDSVDPAFIPPPFEFLAGGDNPIVQTGALAAGTDVMISDSLVTVPVFDSSTPPTNSVTIIGFVQLFVNSDGLSNSAPNLGHIQTTVINMAGCGTGASGQSIIGNGASPVTVRLISSP